MKNGALPQLSTKRSASATTRLAGRRVSVGWVHASNPASSPVPFFTGVAATKPPVFIPRVRSACASVCSVGEVWSLHIVRSPPDFFTLLESTPCSIGPTPVKSVAWLGVVWAIGVRQRVKRSDCLAKASNAGVVSRK